MNNKELFMKEALKEAKKAYKKEEIPVGAVIVKEGEIIALDSVENLSKTNAKRVILRGIKKLPDIKSINKEYAELSDKKDKAYTEYRSLKDEHRELLIHKSNTEAILGISSAESKKEKDKKLTQDTIS
mgnify:CR=1 FL=1